MAEKRLQLIYNHATTTGKKVYISIPKCDDELTGDVIKAQALAIYGAREAFALDIGTFYGARFLTPAQYTEVTIPE